MRVSGSPWIIHRPELKSSAHTQPLSGERYPALLRVIVELADIHAAPVIGEREGYAGEAGADVLQVPLRLLQVIQRYRRIQVMRRMFHDVVYQRPQWPGQDQVYRGRQL